MATRDHTPPPVARPPTTSDRPLPLDTTATSLSESSRDPALLHLFVPAPFFTPVPALASAPVPALDNTATVAPQDSSQGVTVTQTQRNLFLLQPGRQLAPLPALLRPTRYWLSRKPLPTLPPPPRATRTIETIPEMLKMPRQRLIPLSRLQRRPKRRSPQYPRWGGIQSQ